MNINPCALVGLLLALSTADTLASQGRERRGPPTAVVERWGTYFTTESLPSLQDLKKGDNRLAATELVRSAAQAGELSLIYLYDSRADQRRLDAFEQTLFKQPKVIVGTRLFKCGRIDIADDSHAIKTYGSSTPSLTLFDKKGKLAGFVSMKGFHITPAKVISAMRKTAKGYAKLTFDGWVRRYNKFLHEMNLMDFRKKAMAARRTRLEGREEKRKKLQLRGIIQDEEKLEKEEQKLMDSEGKLLELAKVPERDFSAQLVPPRRRR
ncbi:MAG: hypothetical protein VX951_03990 [Planctomycetota bacterium]|nr:hypothetical protein [Planctomycetota bacterium]